MKTSFSHFLPAAVCGLALLLSSCQRGEKDTPTPAAASAEEQEAALSDSYAQAVYDDALRLAGEAETSAQASATAVPVSSSCAQVSLDRAASVLTLDFGTTGCTGTDGRTRKGKITVAYQGQYRTAGSQTVVTFVSYAVDNNAVGGTVTLSGVSRNAAGKLQYTVALANGTLTFADGSGTAQAALTRATEWTTGEGTASAQDDVFTVTDTGTLTRRSGTTYTIGTPVPLRLQSACLSQGIIYPVSGALSFKTGIKPAFVLDYGSGSCDKTATLTVGTASQTIALP